MGKGKTVSINEYLKVTHYLELRISSIYEDFGFNT